MSRPPQDEQSHEPHVAPTYTIRTMDGAIWRGTMSSDDDLRNSLILRAQIERIQDRVLVETRSRIAQSVSTGALMVLAILAGLTIALYLWTSISGGIRPEPTWLAAAGIALSVSVASFITFTQTSKRNRQRAAEYQTALNRADSTLERLVFEVQDKDEQIAALRQQLAVLQAERGKSRTSDSETDDAEYVEGANGA
jgi:hypothetical protein